MQKWVRRFCSGVRYFAAMLLLALFGCPAADLGVELKPAGMSAVSPEDLRRDTELVRRQGPAGWTARMGAMNATPVPGERVCVRQGEGEASPIWTPTPSTLTEAVDAAALISVAKAWDTLAEKPGASVYCLGEGPGERFATLDVHAERASDVDFRLVADALRKRR